LKMKGSFYLAVFFALLGLIGVLLSLTFHYLEAMTLPLALSVVILIVSIIEIIKELRHGSTPVDGLIKPALKMNEGKTSTRSVFWLVGWMIAFAVICWVFGFLIAIPAFGFSYLMWRRRSWLVSAAFALIALAIIYLGFEVALKAELYRGWFFGG
jgi:hypothetical protein